MKDTPSVVRETDAEAIRLARKLIRTARYGALAVLDPATGGPLASRVGIATDIDGTPIILTSMLSAHTRAVLADSRCSLLLGEPGKGDPLAHPRISLVCRATKLDRETDAGMQARRRYLNRHTKADLYVDLGDFSFFRLEMTGASLNGGFGRAYNLERENLLSPVLDGLAQSEQGAIDHMTVDHGEAVKLYARHFGGLEPAEWMISGIDAEGLDLACGDRVGRVWFEPPLAAAGDLRLRLVEMAKQARASLG
ncbi:MAG TPA: HugZ family protein [Mesorhizobium sp.]